MTPYFWTVQLWQCNTVYAQAESSSWILAAWRVLFRLWTFNKLDEMIVCSTRYVVADVDLTVHLLFCDIALIYEFQIGQTDWPDS